MEINSSTNLADDMMFSLDIGTRSCVGIISKKSDESYEIVDSEVVEHLQRAMFDGQIHDIDMVVNVVKKIVDALEERTNYTLKEVAIAAAGRSLKTQKITLERNIDDTREISKEIIDSIEMEGVQKAQDLLISSEKIATKYYCVGYSVVNYYLDDGIIINPKGHKGSCLRVEIIATFLPHIVVDSLYTVMNKAGLEVINLTLEPIAAINIAIPQNLRLLNLALIDVGAGTSDIALTRDGTIVAYGMVDMAGDEITEFLSKEYLLDFREADRLKISLSKESEVVFTDVIGIEHVESSEEIVKKVYPIVKSITDSIAKIVVELNEKSPSAVFCIGGGCQIPNFTECLSESLDVQKQRTVIKDTSMLENINFSKDKLIGPEFITPIGIGYTAYAEKNKDFLQITVNDKPVRLFNSRHLTVSDALILVGYNARNLISTRGKHLKFYANEIEKTLYGEYGESAKIYVNGAMSSLDTRIKNKDSIYVEAAIPGKVKEITISDFLNLPQRIFYNNKQHNIFYDIKVDEKICKYDYIIKENNRLTFSEIKTIKDFSEYHKINMDNLTVNKKNIDSDYLIKNGDVLETILEESNLVTSSNIVSQSEDYKKYNYNEYNYEEEQEEPEEPKFEYNKEFEIKKDKEEEKDIKVYNYIFTVNGETVNVNNVNKELVFIDIFDYIDFDLTVPKGIIELKLNGEKAEYLHKLSTGDIIEIYWR